MKRLAAVSLLLLSLNVCWLSAAEAKPAPKVFVSDGFDGDQVRPRGQTLLGPFTIVLFDLKWQSWGGKKAVATGKWARRPCSVGCDGDPFVDVSKVRVALDKKRECPKGSGRGYYMRRTITFLGKVPKGEKRRITSGFLCWEELSPKPRESAKPLEPHGLGRDVTEVSTGGGQACAIRTSGALWCWGLNQSGQLGDGTRKDRWEPVPVRALSEDVAAVSASESYTCAVTKASGAKCWGANDEGQLGNGTKKPSATPVDVTGLSSGVRAISTGRDHACALTSAGAVKCWGDGYFGQLGNGGTAPRLSPVDVHGLDAGVAAISAGQLSTCALTDSGGVKCWGQLAEGVEYGPTPVDVPGLGSGVASIGLGQAHACALTAAGEVRCWGWPWDGVGNRRGDGTKPMPVPGLGSGVTSLDVGDFHACVITDAHQVKCWGDNLTGELGTFKTESSLEPLLIRGLDGSTKLSAGHIFGCVVTATGGVKCWGNNDDGQLGIGSGREG